MAISKYNVMSDVEFWRHAPIEDDAVFDELCTRLRVTGDKRLTNILWQMFDDVRKVEYDGTLTVSNLASFIANIRPEEHEYFGSPYGRRAYGTLRTRFDGFPRGKDYVKAACQAFLPFQQPRQFLELKLKDCAGMLMGALRVSYSNVGGEKEMLEEAIEDFLVDNTDSTIGDFLRCVKQNSSILNPEERIPWRSAKRDVEYKVRELLDALEEALDDEDETGYSFAADNMTFFVDAVKRRCYSYYCSEETENMMEVERDSMTCCAVSFGTCVKVVDFNPDNPEQEHIIRDAINFVNYNAANRSVRSSVATSVFCAQAIVACQKDEVEKVQNLLSRIWSGCKENTTSGYKNTTGVFIAVVDTKEQTVDFMLADGSRPVISGDFVGLQHMLSGENQIPVAALPAFYQLSHMPETSMRGIDVNDVAHRLVLENNRLMFGDNRETTFLDAERFETSVCEAISRLGHRKWGKAYRRILDKWLSGECEYDEVSTPDKMISSLRRARWAKNNDNPAEKMIAALDEAIDCLSVQTAELRCLEYNSDAKLDAMGVDDRKLDALDAKAERIDKIFKEIEASIEKTREKLTARG